MPLDPIFIKTIYFGRTMTDIQTNSIDQIGNFELARLPNTF